MKCNFSGCDKPQIAKGYCMTHYRRILRNGTLETKLVMNTTVCKECGGGSKNWRKGLCDNCYARKYRNIVSKKDVLEDRKEWEDEWKDMPEFIQEKQSPYKQITIRFESEKDVNEFAKLINQKLTKKTKSIWFPFKSHWGGEGSNKKYVDES